MPENAEPQYLYLTTIGRKSGKPHSIEIWFVEREGRYYAVSEAGEQSDWVQNIASQPEVSFSIGSRDAPLINGTGRLLEPAQQPELTAEVSGLMQSKYDWGEGLIVELTPGSP